MSRTTSRREFVAMGAAAVGAGSAVGAAGAERKRAIRLAHLTDIHLQPELEAAAGLSMCLRHVQGLADRPELIIDGGDSVRDVFEADAARAKVQAELWRRVGRDVGPLPVERAIAR